MRITTITADEAADTGAWYLKLIYLADNQKVEAVPRIDVGLVRNDQDFSNNLLLLKTGKPLLINEQYTALRHRCCH